MSRSPPLRFLVVVLGGWAAMRAAIIAPPWSAPSADAAAKPRAAALALAPPPEVPKLPPPPPAAPERAGSAARAGPPIHGARPSRPRLKLPAPLPTAANAEQRRARSGGTPASPPPSLPAFVTPPRAAAARARAARWSLSFWAFERRGEAAPLAAGGRLGGSQAGARLSYRLNRDPGRPLALSARLAAPLRRAAGAEAALGLDWRPSRRLPVHLLLERRQALGSEGRSAFGLIVYGGISDAPLGRFRIDAYAQAGIVGARSRDPFGDGAIRLSLPLGKGTRLGAGAWAAAQPGLSRLDLGPQAALRLPVAGRAVTLAADWRLRVAGNAEPGSGPTLTMSTEF
jgi:hypothetical protein